MNHCSDSKRNRHPQETANFLSKLFFLFTLDILRKGHRKDLENKDLYEVPSSLKSNKLADNLENLWQNQQTKQKKPSVLKLFLHANGVSYFLLGISQLFVKTFLTITRSVLVLSFAAFFTPNQNVHSKSSAGLYGFATIILLLVQCWYDQWYIFKMMTLEIQVRSALTALFYRKILRSSSLYINNTSVGEILTLMTKDVHTIEMCIKNANTIWISIFQTSVFFYLLSRRMGFFVFFTIIIAILVPVQARLALKCEAIKDKILEETNYRLQTTADVLANLKLIKMYSWGDFFKMKLHDIRMNEMSLTHQIFFLKFLIYTNGFLWTCGTFFVILAIFVTVGKEVTTEIAFLLFDMYRNIGYLLTVVVPLSLCDFAQATASIKRVNKFLSTNNSSQILPSNRNKKVHVKNVTVTLKKEVILNDINFELNSGLVLVTGANGSGKTVLLKTILGDFAVAKGTVITEGIMSYASQNPWFFPGTVRQNIIFGEKFDETRYNQVLMACDLFKDLQLLSYGDSTIVPNVTSLSNSQRVRINLARALYKESDIYLLDDPFASLDPPLADYILKACTAIFFQNKLVFLVTQNTNLFIESECIVLNSGEIVSFNKVAPLKPLEELHHCSLEDNSNFGDESNEESKLLATFPDKNVYHEYKKVGVVNYSVYNTWWQIGGGATLFVLTIFLLLFVSVTMILIEKAIVLWSNNEEKITNYTQLNLTHILIFKEVLNQRRNIITLQIFLILMLLVVTLGFSVMFLSFAKRASVKLHDMVVETLLTVNLHFFDETVGNILNRLSRDLLHIDESVPFLFYESFKIVVPLVSAIVIVVPVQVTFLVALILLIFILNILKNKFVYVSRSLKRMEASARSPVLAYLKASIEGLTTIKSQKSENRIIEEFEGHLNLHISTSFTYVCTTRAFGLCVGWLSSIFVGIVVSRFLVFGAVSATAKIALFQSFLLVELLSTGFLNWAETECFMTSVERILELTEIRRENPCGIASKSWSNLGEIIFQNVCVTYNGMSRPTLHNVNFVINPKEKIGVVGLNNPGTSSMISVLLRVIHFDGRIFVNGVDSKIVSLDFLRSNISLVPADPVIFKGSVKQNLDPFNKHSNCELWAALKTVNLKKFVWDLNVDVCETYIACNTDYKKRFNLARIILEKNSIVIIDNFLKNIDKDTESLVLNLIETVFKNSTIIVITYNMKVLSSVDRIMVLDGGSVVQFDSPSKLLHLEDELFSTLLQKNTPAL